VLKIHGVLGQASEPEMAARLHALEHDGRVEHLPLDPEDMARHRLRAVTDAGTECAIVLARDQRLENGAVLLLTAERAIVVRMQEQRWLTLAPRDAAAALELGYFAGNMHWTVRFDGTLLRIALNDSEDSYFDRLAPLLADGRIRKAEP
jgi:urease accessory protein